MLEFIWTLYDAHDHTHIVHQVYVANRAEWDIAFDHARELDIDLDRTVSDLLLWDDSDDYLADCRYIRTRHVTWSVTRNAKDLQSPFIYKEGVPHV